MSPANRKNPEPRHLPERYTMRRRVLSSKFTRAGDRHLAHTDDSEAPVAASGPGRARPGGSPGAGSTSPMPTSSAGDLPVAAAGGDLPGAATDDGDTEKEAVL